MNNELHDIRTEIVTIETQNKHIVSFESKGHASLSNGKKGENLVCAAVSVLVQTLYLYLKKEGLLQKEEIKDGYLLMILNLKPEEIIRNSFDIILTGLETLKKQHPEDIELLYKQI